jgi:hypothetical protein
MDFLLYIELSAENLQFYLWYRDYIKRFSELPEHEQQLVPIWTPERAEKEMLAAKKEKIVAKIPVETAEILKGTDFDPKAKIAGSDNPNPFKTPPLTPLGNRESMAPSAAGWSDDGSTLRAGAVDYHQKAATAFEEANVLQPCEWIQQWLGLAVTNVS